ncbi:MAG: TetR/AcrR family transcriptional regulator [Candidatus Dormibacteraeota bacterium]|nr:TetR/AcrR family transcriptional regulator [Candidatus Dormibacteraeota bacterium]
MARSGRAAVAEVQAHSDLLPARSVADGTHRRLLEVALLTFGERGFDGVSVRELAETAGIRPSSMYAHLSSKEALLMELVVMGHEEHRDRLVVAHATEPGDVVRRMRALVRAHVRLHAEFPLLARVANRELHALKPVGRARVTKVREAAQNLLLRTIEEGIAEGAFSVPDAWLALAVIGGSGIRVAEWWDPGLGYSIEDVEDAYSEFAIRLLNGPTLHPR